MNKNTYNTIRNIVKEAFLSKLEEAVGNGLKKGDIFKLNGMNPNMMAKLIASKYGANPADFVPGKNGTIVYQPKRTAKPKTEIVSKPENMSVEEYKEKLVIPMKPELQDEEGEEWRPVENKNRYFGGDVNYGNYYEISNLGRLRTINLQNAAKSSISVGYDAPTRNAMQFHLNHKSGMNTCPNVAYMVADAFLGEHDVQDNMVIHIDGDYHNNRADNLKWVPRKKKGKEMSINNIVNETINRMLRESFETKYENAIDTIEYYLNMCSDGHQLSQQQCEQLSNIVDWLEDTDANDNPSTPEWIKAAEEILNQCQPQQIQEKSNSGIEINPENKGKFTATKKRTGKTASELANSKNPLTRKRAQFALNSRKWNKKKSVSEEIITKAIREALENAGQPDARPKWMDILDAINKAGVNQANPRYTAQPQRQAQPEQPQQQTLQPAQLEPKQDANGVQIGQYVFNPYNHTLTGADGIKNVRPQYCNVLNELCKNMGQDTEIAKIFNITDDRGFRVLMFNLRKLFAGDPNVQIVTSRGGKARLQVNNEGLNESVEDEEPDYIQNLVDTLRDCGWSFYNYYPVESKTTGKTGIRYEIKSDSDNSCSVEGLKQRLTQAIPQELLVFSVGQHRYAQELTSFSVVLLDV